MDSDDIGRGFTDSASGDVFSDVVISNRHHRKWGISRQPVGFVIPGSIVADIVEVTEEERHG